MAEQDEQTERAVEIDRGSWLQNNEFHRLSDGTVTWTLYNAPEIPDFEGDLRIRLEDAARLDQLAERFYGNPNLWWLIAEKNDLRRPLVEVSPGVQLVIPEPAEVADMVDTGEFGR